MIVSPHRPGGGFRDVQHVGTRQFSVLLARILGANVPPQFIARWNGSISVESHSNCMQMGRHMLKQAKTRERKCWLTGRKAKCLLLYCVCVCMYEENVPYLPAPAGMFLCSLQASGSMSQSVLS